MLSRFASVGFSVAIVAALGFGAAVRPTATSTRATSCPPQISGYWTGTWTSTAFPPGGGIWDAELVMSDGVITGTVTVSNSVLPPNQPVTGIVSCEQITFGTIGGSVTFTGTIGPDGTTGSGTYVTAAGDAGSWRGASAGAPGAENLVANPSFEDGTSLPSGWHRAAGFDEALAGWPSVPSHSGAAAASASIVVLDCTQAQTLWVRTGAWQSDLIPIDPNSWYSASVWRRSADGNDFQATSGLSIREFDSAGDFLGGAGLAQATAESWQEFSVVLFPAAAPPPDTRGLPLDPRTASIAIELVPFPALPSSCFDGMMATSLFDDVTLSHTPPPTVDSDGDGVVDALDACLGTSTGSTVDASGCSQLQVDQDVDGVCDPAKTSALCTGSDNCPTTPNSDQGDRDLDRIGDACDLKETRAIVFVQGINSRSGSVSDPCDMDGFATRAPSWVVPYLQSQSWISDRVEIEDLYFSYGGYCIGGNPTYVADDTCDGVATAASDLKNFIEGRAPAKVSIVAHSMGGLVAAYLVATEDEDWVRSHIGSIATFDSPLRGVPPRNIDLEDRFGDCNLADDPPDRSLLDLLRDSTVVSESSGAAMLVPFYTIDAGAVEGFGIEAVPGGSTHLDGDRMRMESLFETHSQIWDIPSASKKVFIGCAVIEVQSRKECNSIRKR